MINCSRINICTSKEEIMRLKVCLAVILIKTFFFKVFPFVVFPWKILFCELEKMIFKCFFIIYCISIKTLLILINYQKGHIYIYIVKKTKNNLFYDLNKFFTRRIRLINKYQS